MTVIPHDPGFAIQEIPFSFHGSWFNVSPVIAQHTRAADLHLVSHQNGTHAVLRLVPLAPDTGDRASATWQAAPSRLTWTGPHGRITLVYESADTLRVSGEGLDLDITPAATRLTSFSGTYLYRDPVDGSYQFTSYETGRRYRITPLAGTTLRVSGSEGLADAARRLTVTGPGRWKRPSRRPTVPGRRTPRPATSRTRSPEPRAPSRTSRGRSPAGPETGPRQPSWPHT